MVQDGKQTINVDGKDFILEKPIKADIAIIAASIADTEGNLYYKGTTRNFNPLMAAAADTVIVEAEEIVEAGNIKPEDVHTPAILVDYIIN
jgi:acetate CoA/acetoacetate CoA-transferase alpha subunit